MGGDLVSVVLDLALGIVVGVLVIGLGVGLARLEQLQRRLDATDARVTALEGLFFVRRCRACQCTDDEACMSGCWWVDEDLCSSCADDEASGSSLEGGRR